MFFFLKEIKKVAEGKKEDEMTELFLKEINDTEINIFEETKTNKKYINYN